ncbi:uncharacterized protein LOC110442102 [Mizuhopecten yessoensis]|uniref:Uncharacterized protein n=1 Tax=Mizuhopecten yessoensis TaxID=6573 RepID=A0A210PHZ5_MIZYE|nr:uncharacterized protein LOC110442102 [Mizuhopecten yessoensis]OWF36115.1 hypothetical protein KP79_PYT23087 [Mizuhopecten yessoensis]
MTNTDVAGLPLGAPPINNACLPTLFNKLDANVRERNRVRNSFLDHSLRFQQKIIDKYHMQAMRFYVREKNNLGKDIKRIIKKTPNLEDIPYLEANALKGNFQRKEDISVPYKGYCTEPKEFNTIQTATESKPFCVRYFCHHFPKKPKFMRNRKLPPLKSVDDSFRQTTSKGLLLSQRFSASDHFLASGNTRHSQLNSDSSLGSQRSILSVEDDAMTI